MSTLEVVDLVKDYGATRVVDGINLAVGTGEIVGLVGENGAGKSTLLNMLSGVVVPTAGRIAIDGKPVVPTSYPHANKLGIWRVFQDPALIPALPVYENLFLGHERSFRQAKVFRNRRAMIRTARDIVAEMDLDIDVMEPVQKFGSAMRQAIEVARAAGLPKVLGLEAGHVLLDEPTTGLTGTEVVKLFDLMRRMSESGTGMLFVSHRLGEISAVCDRFYVLKDGVLMSESKPGQMSEESIHRVMVGRERAADYYFENLATRPTEPLLKVDQLRGRAASKAPQRTPNHTLHDASLHVEKGEIVGIGGLLGSGKNELLRAIAGISPSSDGRVELDGCRLKGALAQRRRHGLAFLSGNRREESIIGSLPVSSNIALGNANEEGGPSGRLGMWRPGRELQLARRCISDLQIKGDARMPAGSLSGGNQQKVAIARCIQSRPKLLLIENPTAGVDIDGKFEIYRLLRTLAQQGTAVLYATDDLPELVGLSTRVYVMRDGGIAGEFAAGADEKPDEHELVALMTGALEGTK